MWKILRDIEKYQLSSKTGYDGGYYIKQMTSSWEGAYYYTIENTGKGSGPRTLFVASIIYILQFRIQGINKLSKILWDFNRK